MDKVYIAIPCLDNISARFAQCLLDLKAPEGMELDAHFNIGTLVYDSRNHLAEMAIASKAKYTFWLDSDMTFMPDTLISMMDTLQKNNLSILTAPYYKRRHPFTPTLFKRFDVNPKAGIRSEEFDELPDELFKVEACGFGCVLMKTDVLMNVLVSFGPQFTPIGIVGEDLSFCWRARKLRNEIWCDPSIALGHEAHMIITKTTRSAFINGNAVKVSPSD